MGTNIDNLSDEQIIFASLLHMDDNTRSRRVDLVRAFNSDAVFKNEYFVLFKIIKDNKPTLKVDKRFVSTYLYANRAELLTSSCIDLSGYNGGDSTDDDSAFTQFAECTFELIDTLLRCEISDDDFDNALEAYRLKFCSAQAVSIFETAAVITTDGKRIGRKTLAGYGDASAYARTELSRVDKIVNKSKRTGIIVYGVNDQEDGGDTPPKRITSYGISALDEHIGGIFEGDMVSVQAPTKTGKSKFCTFIAHHAITECHCNVVFWPAENGRKLQELMLRARHFDALFNKNVTSIRDKHLISDSMIKKNELSSEMKEMEASSYLDLRTNQDYGRFAIIDENFNLDTYLQILDDAVQTIHADFVFVDYLQMIGAGTSKLQKNVCISEAYIQTLQYLKNNKIGGIFPAQFKQTFVTSLKGVETEELGKIETRDSGGESYEVTKTPDVNLALYATIEQLKAGFTTCIPLLSRNFEPFDPFGMNVDFGCCNYKQVKSEE